MATATTLSALSSIHFFEIATTSSFSTPFAASPALNPPTFISPMPLSWLPCTRQISSKSVSCQFYHFSNQLHQTREYIMIKTIHQYKYQSPSKHHINTNVNRHQTSEICPVAPILTMTFSWEIRYKTIFSVRLFLNWSSKLRYPLLTKWRGFRSLSGYMWVGVGFKSKQNTKKVAANSFKVIERAVGGKHSNILVYQYWTVFELIWSSFISLWTALQ